MSVKNIRNGRKNDQHFPFQGPPKFTQKGVANFPSGNLVRY
jgi:hypothetical protein